MSLLKAPRTRTEIALDIGVAASAAFKRNDWDEGNRLFNMLMRIHDQMRLTRIANRISIR